MKPKIYVTGHPADADTFRVMFKDQAGVQSCLADDLEDEEAAERIRKWVASAKPQTLREAQREARMAGR